MVLKASEQGKEDATESEVPKKRVTIINNQNFQVIILHVKTKHFVVLIF